MYGITQQTQHEVEEQGAEKHDATAAVTASNRPVTGMVAIRPTGRANNAAPSCASFKFSWCCIDGMRDAQVV